MRLLTRCDLDGLACAVILQAHEAIEEVVLVHPQSITDKLVEIRSTDILANLPYHPGCGMWFDHHLLTESNEKPPSEFIGRYRIADSAAQLVWEHYGSESSFAELVRETNRLDSAKLVEDDVLQPKGYILLGFTLDPSSGLPAEDGYFHHCLELLRSKSIDEILIDEMVRQRVIRLFEQNEDFCWTLMKNSRLLRNVVVTDFRSIPSPAPVGNRFLVYTLFPEANVSIRVSWGSDHQHVMVNLGHSIFDRSCNTSIGELMSNYGGGGHRGAGSAPLDTLAADPAIYEIIETLQRNG